MNNLLWNSLFKQTHVPRNKTFFMNIDTCRRTNEQEIRDFFRHPFLVCLLDCITQTWFDPTYKGLIDQIKSEGMNGNKAPTLTYIYVRNQKKLNYVINMIMLHYLLTSLTRLLLFAGTKNLYHTLHTWGCSVL